MSRTKFKIESVPRNQTFLFNSFLRRGNKRNDGRVCDRRRSRGSGPRKHEGHRPHFQRPCVPRMLSPIFLRTLPATGVRLCVHAAIRRQRPPPPKRRARACVVKFVELHAQAALNRSHCRHRHLRALSCMFLFLNKQLEKPAVGSRCLQDTRAKICRS